MINPNKILFVSDLHLSARSTHLNRLFTTFIEKHANDAAQVYLLGDVFDAWIGDDDLNLFTETIAQQLKSLSENGVRLYFMPGNRDFLLQETYCRLAGLKLLKDPTVISINQINYLLTHGDGLCTDDIDYQHYRNKIRDPLFIKKVLQKPLWLRRLLARYLRWRSQAHLAKVPQSHYDKLDINVGSMQELMKQNKVQHIIHGHTHKPSIHLFNPHDDVWSTHYVLSDWGDKGNFLCLQDNKLELVYFTEDK